MIWTQTLWGIYDTPHQAVLDTAPQSQEVVPTRGLVVLRLGREANHNRGNCMIAKLSWRVAAGGVALALTASGGSAVASPTQHPDAKGGAPSALAKIKRSNDSLDAVARLLRRATAEPAVRQELRARIANRGTLDRAVTLDSLSESSRVRQGLIDAYRDQHAMTQSEAQSAVDELLASLPPSQVSVPVKFGSWNAAKAALLVAYMPVGTDDEAVTTVTAYDANGEAVELDALVEPKQPVIVIGPDETAYHDNSAAPRTVSRPVAAAEPKQQLRATTCYNAYLTYVRLLNDHEPWTLGPAETFLSAQGPGTYFYDDFPYLEFDGDQVLVNYFLGCARGDVRFYWWEDDAENTDYYLKFGGWDFGFGMSNADDVIGGRIETASRFSGGTEFTTDFGGLYQRAK